MVTALTALLTSCAASSQGVLTPKDRETLTSADVKPGQLVNFGQIFGNEGESEVKFLDVEAIDAATELDVVDIWAFDADQAGMGVGVLRGDLVELAKGRIQRHPITAITIEPNEFRWYVIVSIKSNVIGVHQIGGLRTIYEYEGQERQQNFPFTMKITVMDCEGEDRQSDVCVRQHEPNPFESPNAISDDS